MTDARAFGLSILLHYLIRSYQYRHKIVVNRNPGWGYALSTT